MTADSSAIVSKVCTSALVLTNAEVGCGDHLEARGKQVAIAYLLAPAIAEQRQVVAEVEARGTAIVHLEAGLDRQSNQLRQTVLGAAFGSC